MLTRTMSILLAISMENVLLVIGNANMNDEENQKAVMRTEGRETHWQTVARSET